MLLVSTNLRDRAMAASTNDRSTAQRYRQIAHIRPSSGTHWHHTIINSNFGVLFAFFAYCGFNANSRIVATEYR